MATRAQPTVKAAVRWPLHFTTTVEPGQSWVIQLRFTPSDLPEPFANFDAHFAQRKAEADAFYAGIQPATLTPDQRYVQRQAFAGLLWCKQYYHYLVYRWLTGDPTQPPPPPERWTGAIGTGGISSTPT